MTYYAGLLAAKDVPEWVLQKAHWRSALFVLAAPVLARRDPWQFVDFDRRSIQWLVLERLGASWSQEERLLIRVAHDLYNGQGGVAMGELLRMLSEESFQHFLDALKVWRGEHDLKQAIGA